MDTGAADAWLTAAAVLALLGLIVVVARSMVKGAQRGARAAAAELNLAAEALGYQGTVDGVRVRVAANARRLPAVLPPVSPPPVEPSATGEVLVLARIDPPVPTLLWWESAVPRGRGLREQRRASGNAELDNRFSLFAADLAVAHGLARDAAVAAVMVDVRDKFYCLLEIDAENVALHGGHYGRVTEMVHDAARIAAAIAQCVRLGRVHR